MQVLTRSWMIVALRLMTNRLRSSRWNWRKEWWRKNVIHVKTAPHHHWHRETKETNSHQLGPVRRCCTRRTSSAIKVALWSYPKQTLWSKIRKGTRITEWFNKSLLSLALSISLLQDPEWDVSSAFVANAVSHIRPKTKSKSGRKSKENKENEARIREVSVTAVINILPKCIQKHRRKL